MIGVKTDFPKENLLPNRVIESFCDDSCFTYDPCESVGRWQTGVWRAVKYVDPNPVFVGSMPLGGRMPTGSSLELELKPRDLLIRVRIVRFTPRGSEEKQLSRKYWF